MEKELAERNMELELSKKEYQELVLAAQKDMSALESKLKKEQLERKELYETYQFDRQKEMTEFEDGHKRTQMARKDYYEESSHQRKDGSELLKLVPAVITTAVGAYALWNRFS